MAVCTGWLARWPGRKRGRRSARNAGAKVSVFTGPVLAPQDPTVLGVQVPTAFWKIVAYSAGGRLRAHGFMQWQIRLVRDIRVRPEALETRHH